MDLKKNPYPSHSCHEETFYEIQLIHAFILPSFTLLLTMINNSIVLYRVQLWEYSRTHSTSMDFPKWHETYRKYEKMDMNLICQKNFKIKNIKEYRPFVPKFGHTLESPMPL